MAFAPKTPSRHHRSRSETKTPLSQSVSAGPAYGFNASPTKSKAADVNPFLVENKTGARSRAASPIKRATTGSIDVSERLKRQASAGVIRKGGVESRLDVVTRDYNPPPKKETRRSKSQPSVSDTLACSPRPADIVLRETHATVSSRPVILQTRWLPPSRCLPSTPKLRPLATPPASLRRPVSVSIVVSSRTTSRHHPLRRTLYSHNNATSCGHFTLAPARSQHLPPLPRASRARSRRSLNASSTRREFSMTFTSTSSVGALSTFSLSPSSPVHMSGRRTPVRWFSWARHRMVRTSRPSTSPRMDSSSASASVQAKLSYGTRRHRRSCVL